MRKLLAVVLALALMMPGTPAAASSDLRVTVRPGFDGMVRPGSWAPVDIDLTNAGPNVTGNVEISVTRRPSTQTGSLAGQSLDYSVPVTIPTHSSKRFSTAVYVPPFFDRLQVRLVSNGQTLYQDSLPLQRLDPAQVFCGVVSTDQSAFSALNSLTLGDAQRQTHLVHLDLPDLPTNPQLLSSLDCLIISDYSTRGLSPLQQSALTAWVSEGGVLTIGTGPQGAAVLEGLPRDLLPARLDGTVPIRSLTSLASYLGVPADPAGPWLAGNLKLTEGSVLVADESQPLVVVGRRGRGAVFMVALSLTQKPLRGWSGLDRFWVYVLSYARLPDSSFAAYYRQDFGWGRLPREVLIRGGGIAGPESWRFLLGLLLFALLVGPGNLLILSRLGRRDLALLTAPALSILVTAGALIYAQKNRQGDVVVNQVSIVRTWDGSGVGSVHSFVGIFALHSQHYGLMIPPNALVATAATSYLVPRSQFDHSTPPAQVLASSQPQLQGIDLEPGSLSSFSLDGHLAEPGRINGNIVLDGDQLKGQVTNGLASTIYGAALIAGTAVQPLGDLRPGASHPISLRLANDSPIGYRDLAQVVDRLYPGLSRGSPGARDPRYQIVTAALNPYQSYGGHVDLGSLSLIGWLDRPVDTVTYSDTGKPARQYTLFTTNLPLEVSGAPSTIPDQLIDRQPLLSPYTARVDPTGLMVNAGESIGYQFSSPTDPAHFSLRSLTLATAAATPASGTLALYDWRAGRWVEIPFALGNLSIPNPERFFSATGLVRIQFQNKSTSTIGATPVKFTRFQLLIGGVGR